MIKTSLVFVWIVLFTLLSFLTAPILSSEVTEAEEKQELCAQLRKEGEEAEEKENYSLALQKYQEEKECLLKTPGLKETKEFADCLKAIGKTLGYLGDTAGEMDYFRNALELYLNINGGEENADVAGIYALMGISLTEKSQDADFACELLEKALAIYRIIEEKDDIKVIFLNLALGKALNIKEEYKRAIDKLEEGLEAALKLEVPGSDSFEYKFMLIEFYLELSNALNGAGEYDKSLEYLKEALKLCESIKDNKEISEFVLPMIYLVMASVHSNMKHYEEAIKYYTMALEIIDTIPSAIPSSEMNGAPSEISGVSLFKPYIYCSIGGLYFDQGDEGQAIQYYEKAIGYVDIELDKLIEFDKINQEKQITGNHEDIRKFLKATVHSFIAGEYKERKNYEKALEYYEKALSLIKETNIDPAMIAAFLGSIASLNKDYYYFNKALNNYEEALELVKKSTNHDALAFEASIYKSIGGIYAVWYDYTTALEKYQAALDIFRKYRGEIHQLTANMYLSISDTYRKLGDPLKAMEYALKAQEIYTILKLDKSLADVYLMFGHIHQYMEEYNPAIENFEKASKIYEYFGMEDELAEAWLDIGGVYLGKGRYDKAIEYYMKVQRIVAPEGGLLKPDAGPMMVVISGNLAGTLFMGGYYSDAIEGYKKILKILIPELGNNHPNVAAFNRFIGDAYSAMGYAATALEYYNSSLAALCKETNEKNCLVSHITLRALYEKARALASLQSFKEAAEMYESAAEMLDTLRGTVETESAKTGFGARHYEIFPEGIGVYMALAKVEDPKVNLKRAFEFAERGIARVLLEMIGRSRAIVDGGLPEDVLREGRSLGASLEAARGAVEKFENQPKVMQRDEDRKIVYDRMAEAEKALEEYEARLMKDYPDYAELMRPRVRTLAEIREKTLRPGEAALEFILGEDASYLIFITKDKLLVEELPPAKEIEKLVAEFRYKMMPFDCSIPDKDLQECKEKNDDESSCQAETDEIIACSERARACKVEGRESGEKYKQCLDEMMAEFEPEAERLGGKLYDILIAPIEKEIGGAAGLLVIPTGDLFFLPFEALKTEREGREIFIAELFRIRYAPSLSVLYLSGEESGKVWDQYRQWLGFGDPVYENKETKGCKPPDPRARGMEYSEDTANTMASYVRALQGVGESPEERGGVWCRIPGTGEEALAIAGLFGVREGTGDVNLGLEANEARFKSEAKNGQRYLHVASHGTLGEGGANEPAVVLSLIGNEGTGEDGFVKMSEIFNMKVPAQMVALSACKTGQGKMEKGEGVAGLSRAFMYAGTESLVVSLWPVADVETRDFMVDFYGRLKAGEEREAALMEAKRKMIKEKLHPYYWAPFIYIGLPN